MERGQQCIRSFDTSLQLFNSTTPPLPACLSMHRNLVQDNDRSRRFNFLFLRNQFYPELECIDHTCIRKTKLIVKLSHKSLNQMDTNHLRYPKTQPFRFTINTRQKMIVHILVSHGKSYPGSFSSFICHFPTRQNGTNLKIYIVSHHLSTTFK